MRLQFPETIRLELSCRSFAKNERSSICREAIRYNYPESVISKFPWRKIAKVRWGQEMENRFQGCSALSQGKIRNDKSCFRRLQRLSALFQGKSELKQHWFRADFFAPKFWFFSAVSEKISAVQLCFRVNQRWNSSDSALIFWSENLVFQRCFRENQLCFRENQHWNSADSALIFLLWKFSVSELFQRKSALFRSESALFQRKSALLSSESALFQRKSALFSSESALFQRKSALFSSESALFQRKSALFQRWFLALKISVFSAVQSWIRAVQRFSGNEQRWNRRESILNQSWSALNVSETSTRIMIQGRKPKKKWKFAWPSAYRKLMIEAFSGKMKPLVLCNK